MGDWNFDITQAPKGEVRPVTRAVGKSQITKDEHVPETIIAAGSDGVVTLSRWLPKEGRWNMFTRDVPPIAWQPWPKHPEAN